ncbi:tRNA glutamyl-Q(34) synthetase GluQRS [Nitratireductor sp. CAU 1489]|uniref:tRNA glutamyl-Q(34) synthetase GluQRS n=1 Tax=Nitratireductor arenosus TaxID=2682096 RepID=A0A844QDL1_9HYPH|nr:tRNA glutamyl-Q(34) synthetase GluQRS [Nitratireductor arenosus]MVA96091.1 tRNA glutamyl-Q(34) synthetase GluQRS [Nitratireductor arenosus]
MTVPVFRFAPSPNGALHLGHAYSALLNADLCAASGGRMLLRMEDIDTERCRPEYEVAILADLAWLGLSWEEPMRRQSDHFPDYRGALDRLIDAELVYPAFMSRGEVRAFIADAEIGHKPWPRDPDGAPVYPPSDKTLSLRERQRRMADGQAFSWRLDMRAALDRLSAPLEWMEDGGGPHGETGRVRAEPAAWGDVVLARKDSPASYNLCVVVDDAIQGVSHVVRGRDLFYATAVHRLLQDLLGLPVPAYLHHELVLDADGRKLSKSRGDTALRALRAGGARPDDIRRMVGLPHAAGGAPLKSGE